MFEFKKLCDSYEKLSTVEKGLLLAEKSASITAKLCLLDIPGVDPISALAGFIIGSVVSDGKINEQEYLLIYPSLARVFGDGFDFASIKDSFEKDGDGRRMIAEYTEELMSVISFLDESVADDLIMLCLCVTAIDGRVSLKEKNYIKRLCRA